MALARSKLDPRKLSDARRFRRRLQDFHADFVKPGDLVFDVGANVGHYTAAFRVLGAHVVALEPDPAPLRKLRRRFRRDDCVTVLAKGASEVEGAQRLLVSPEGGAQCTTMSPEWAAAMQESPWFSEFRWEPADEVPVTTLDSLIAEFGRPSFIKIDVEGYELPVVKGLSQPVPALSLESHPEVQDRTMAALDHLQSIGGEAEFMYVPGAVAPFLGRAMPGAVGEWSDLNSLRQTLETTTRPGDWGDVIVRLRGES